MSKFNIPTEKYPIEYYYIKEWFTFYSVPMQKEFIVMKRSNDKYFYIEKSSGFHPFNDIITTEYLKEFEFIELPVDYIEFLEPLKGCPHPLRKQYKIGNGLSYTTENPLFTNHKDAWEYLRQVYAEASRFMVLWVRENFKIPINNPDYYIYAHNKKYAPRPIGHGPDNAEILDKNNPFENVEIWIPVFSGLTGDAYNISTEYLEI